MPCHAYRGGGSGVGCRSGFRAGGEVRRTYGVNEERLAQKAAEREAQPSVLVSYIKANLAEDSLLHKVYFALYMLMPFAILAISLWMEFTGGWGDERKLFMLGLSEFIFGVGNAGMGAGVYPWFCDFDIVGWIVTIVCFCYMFRLLMKQAGLLMGFVNRRSCASASVGLEIVLHAAPKRRDEMKNSCTENVQEFFCV